MATERPRRRPPPPTPLPVGTRLGRYEVRKVLGRGVGGVVYRVVDLEADTDLDRDPDVERDLALREYLPAALALREGNAAVVPRSPAQAEAFVQGLAWFVSQSERLARISHPSLVRVHHAWQANGTAYRLSTLVHGRSLADTLQARGRAPSENSLRAILGAVLDALEALHGAGLEHGDVAPHNIVLDPSGRPVLLDLDLPRGTDAVDDDGPRDGYAPIECHGAAGEARRGPWTDLYALGATVHFMISAKPPPPAPGRSDGDLVGLQLQRSDGRYSSDFLGVIDWMLAREPADRPQSVAQLRDGLAGQGVPERHLPGKRVQLGAGLRRHRRRLWLLGALGLLLLLGLALAGLHLSGVYRLRAFWS